MLEKLGIPTKGYEIDGIKGVHKDPLALANRIGRRIRLVRLYNQTESMKGWGPIKRIGVAMKVAGNEEKARFEQTGRFKQPRFRNDDGFTCVNREPGGHTLSDDFEFPDGIDFSK